MSPTPFIERLLPAPLDGGFRSEDLHVWGTSVVAGGDGQYHMFAACWPVTAGRDLSVGPQGSFYGHTVICRAVSATPVGPYRFEEIVLRPRAGSWDGVSCHNPAVLRVGGLYVLYYCGYNGTKQIGYAASADVRGPWKRLDEPLFAPAGGHKNNPAPCLTPDGKVLLLFRGEGMRLYAAVADAFDAPYRIRTGPLLPHAAEDPFVWHNGTCCEMIVEDNRGHYTGSRLNGAHFTSHDGLTWTPMDPVKCYGHPIRMSDGSELHGRQEKPSLLLDEAGVPTHLFLVKVETDAATQPAFAGIQPGSRPVRSVCIPLRRP